MYSELISPIMAKHEMAKIFNFANGIFLSFELRLAMFIAYVKEKEQTLLEGIQMAKNKNPFQIEKTKSHLQMDSFLPFEVMP